MRKKILILVFTNLKKDARVKRQIDFIKHQHDVTVACYDAAPEGFQFIQLKQVNLSLVKKVVLSVMLFFRFFRNSLHILYPYSDAKEKIADKQFDLIIANDVETLMLAYDLAGLSTKVIFDAHEYAPRHFENRLMWRLFFQPLNIYLCRKYLHRINGMITLGQNIADEYEKNFSTKPIVITNAPDYYEMQPTAVDSKEIKLVHQGIANHSRQLELMIDMMKYLPENYSLNLFLMIPESASFKTRNYIDELKKLAAFTTRIRFLEPVPHHQLIAKLNPYDLGIILVPPINFNYANGLPNKFFEFVQARLGMAIGPSPEMVRYLKKYQLGVVADSYDPRNLAEKITQLTPEDIRDLKINAGKAAHELNSSSNKQKLQRLVSDVLFTEAV